MFSSLEVMNNQFEGDIFTILLTYGDEDVIIQLFKYRYEGDKIIDEFLFEDCIDDDDDDICDVLHDKLSYLICSKVDVLRNINKFTIKSNIVVDIKRFVDIFNFFVLDKYSKILGKRVQNITFLTNEDKSILKNKGYFYW